MHLYLQKKKQWNNSNRARVQKNASYQAFDRCILITPATGLFIVEIFNLPVLPALRLITKSDLVHFFDYACITLHRRCNFNLSSYNKRIYIYVILRNVFSFRTKTLFCYLCQGKSNLVRIISLVIIYICTSMITRYRSGLHCPFPRVSNS